MNNFLIINFRNFISYILDNNHLIYLKNKEKNVTSKSILYLGLTNHAQFMFESNLFLNLHILSVIFKVIFDN